MPGNPITLAERLLAAGIPVVVVRPGDRPPPGWQHLTAADCDLSGFRPAKDALALVGGHGIDAIDVDIKAGGSVDHLPPFKSYGTTRTPSGGAHYIVPSSGLGKVSPLTTADGHVGDYVGGRPDGTGRLLLFLPGSVRMKYPDGGYTVEDPWRIEECLAAGPDPDLVIALTDAGGSRRERTVYVDDSPVRPAADGVHAYAAVAVACELAKLDALPYPWHEGAGWDQGTFNVACNLVEFANSHWSGYSLADAENDLHEHAPTDAVWGSRNVAAKWAAALNTVSGGGRPVPKDLQGDPADDFDVVPDDENAPSGAGWLPVDLSAYASGTHVGPVTSLMARTDGVCLLYPGMTHSLHGESESGKSLVAQAEAAVQLKAGKWVLYADYEADPGSVTERLLLMGVTAEQVKRFVYVQPEADPSQPTARAAFDKLLSRSYALAVIDGVNEALAQAPAKARSSAGLGGNDDITVWHDHLPRVVARRTGAAVLLIDHVSKSPDAGRFAIGGQAKMASISGAAYVAKPRVPLGRNMIGEVDLYVGKDRHGHVRSNAGAYDARSRLQLVATAVVDGTNDQLSVDLVQPVRAGAVSADDRREGFMCRVSEWLHSNEFRDLYADKGASTNVVKAAVKGDNHGVKDALEVLVAGGYVRREPKGQSYLHWPVRPYVPELEDEDED